MPSLVEELVLLAIEDDGAIAPAAGDLGFGMALLGACLVELGNAGRIDVDLSAVLVLDTTPTGHPALDGVLKTIATGDAAPVAQWILRLSADAATVVRQTLDGLISRRVLRFEEARYLWVLKERRYPLRDGREQQDAKLRIMETLLGEQLPTPHDSVLLGASGRPHGESGRARSDRARRRGRDSGSSGRTRPRHDDAPVTSRPATRRIHRERYPRNPAYHA